MKQISEVHCQSCGRTGRESGTAGGSGYSACCNELMVGGWGQPCETHEQGGDCSHK